MRKVYAVTTGSYSDYRVQCAFETLGCAEVEQRRLETGNSVLELVVYEGLESPARVMLHHLTVELWDDGTLNKQRIHSDEEWEYDSWSQMYMSDRPYVRFVRAPVHKNRGGRLEITGTDLTACQKTMNDYVAQWRAQGYRLNEMNR